MCLICPLEIYFLVFADGWTVGCNSTVRQYPSDCYPIRIKAQGTPAVCYNLPHPIYDLVKFHFPSCCGSEKKAFCPITAANISCVAVWKVGLSKKLNPAEDESQPHVFFQPFPHVSPSKGNFGRNRCLCEQSIWLMVP